MMAPPRHGLLRRTVRASQDSVSPENLGLSGRPSSGRELFEDHGERYESVQRVTHRELVRQGEPVVFELGVESEPLWVLVVDPIA